MNAISQTAEYALRAVVRIATGGGAPVTTREIADSTRVPADYLSKVLQMLARGGIVQARRGQGGGFVLTRSPEELTILDVVGAVDPIRRIRTCPLGLPEHRDRLCPLHRRLDAALEAVEASLGATTVAEIMREGGGGMGEPGPAPDRPRTR